MKNKNDYNEHNSGGMNNSNSHEELLRELNFYKQDRGVQRNIKNNLYAFILSQGLFSELQEYQDSFDMTESGGLERTMDQMDLYMSKQNDHGNSDFINYTTQQLRRELEIEDNIKENLYDFILQKGLFKELEEYEMNGDNNLRCGQTIQQLLRNIETVRGIQYDLVAFIFQKGLSNELEEYEKNNDIRAPGGHLKSIEYLRLMLPQNSN